MSANPSPKIGEEIKLSIEWEGPDQDFLNDPETGQLKRLVIGKDDALEIVIMEKQVWITILSSSGRIVHKVQFDAIGQVNMVDFKAMQGNKRAELIMENGTVTWRLEQ